MLKIKLTAALCALSMLTGITALAQSPESVSTSMSSAVESDTALTTDETSLGTDTTSGAGTGDPAEKPTPEKVQDIVYRFLTEELELTPAAAAGIMGNVMIECTFDPTALAIDTNGLYSFGLMMWNGPRFEALKEWCADNGYEHTDPRGQLGYLKWELLNTEKSAYATMKSIPNTIEGACKAAILWASEFERCTRTSFGLRIFYALNLYWPEYAGGTVSDTHGIYGYYYNVPENIEYGKALTLYGAVVSFSSNLKSITAGVYTEDGELVTGRSVERDALVGNIGVLDSYIVFNKLPRGSYYYTITAVNEAGEYIVERHAFTVSDEETGDTLIKENSGYVKCGFGAYCPGHVFSDMPAHTNWAHSGIDYVVDAGLFEGKPGGLFAPKENMSRAMFVTVLCRLCEMYGIFSTAGDAAEESGSSSFEDSDSMIDSIATFPPTVSTQASETDEPSAPSESEITDEPEVAPSTDNVTGDVPVPTVPTGSIEAPDAPVDTFDYYFKDVPRGKWFTDAVYKAAATGLVLGKSADTFAPNEALTRAQLATLMYRFAAACGVDTSYTAELDSFADGASVPAWAKDAVSWAVAAGLITGTKDNGILLLDPMGHATRAQVSAIVQRFVVLIENGGVPVTPESTESTETIESTEADTTVETIETITPIATLPEVTVIVPAPTEITIYDPKVPLETK